jgi:hypothetical protein
MRIHKICGLFPILRGTAFEAFKQDIAVNGQRDPIWTWKGKIIDGRNRYRACKELGIPPRFKEWSGNGSLVAFVISANLHRRHLNTSQRAAVAVDLLPWLEGEAKERQRRHGGTARGRKATLGAELPEVNGRARDHAAVLLGTNGRTVSDAKKVKELDPALFEKVKAGEMRVDRARRQAERDHDRQKPRARPEVVTTHHGENADLIRQVAELYLADGATVADVTYGKGAFWSKTNTRRFNLLASDLRPCCGVRRADFRHLPYQGGSIDVVVLDPPYVHHGGSHVLEERYENHTIADYYHRDIMALYHDGMTEAVRVLKPEGMLWCKCKDQVEGGEQCWSHVELYQEAVKLGFYGRDLFVLVPTGRTSPRRWDRQLHARKNHSFLWVFQKPETAAV